ncbi:hypothetical protein JCM12298_24070 [Desulfothermus naphthae]
MKKVSIIWFSKSKNTYNRISLTESKTYLLLFLHLLIYSGLIILSGLLIYQHFKISNAKKEIASLSNKIVVITTTLKKEQQRVFALEQDLKQKIKKISSLEKKLSTVQDELADMEEMEDKIKNFLGLESDKTNAEDKFSHQGGFEYNTSPEKKKQTILSIEDQNATHFKKIKNIVSYSTDLRESLAQLVDYLEKRHKKLRHMPSILPIKGDKFWISCGFGWRTNPFTQQREFHAAIDIASAWKTPIVAPADGIVIKVGKNSIVGNYVRIRHTPHIITLYGHLYKTIVKEGDKVKRWDVIGYMGNTGHSTGTHLHYKIVVDGRPVNPKYYIWDRRLKSLGLR